MILRKLDGWLTAKVGDELMMMSTENGGYIALNEIGARIWELMDTCGDFDVICARLDREFDVAPDICRAEVKAFVDDLVKHGAVAVEVN